jgi:hypothetical protein
MKALVNEMIAVLPEERHAAFFTDRNGSNRASTILSAMYKTD